MFGWYLAVGDFNGDGKLDLVITFGGLASGTSVVLGNGDGTFAHATTLPTTNTECHVGTPLVADFDGDGSLDIAIMGYGGHGGGFCFFTGTGTVLVFAGNGDGTFKAPATFTTSNAGDLVATTSTFWCACARALARLPVEN
jgi:FG-GAP-like repeat